MYVYAYIYIYIYIYIYVKKYGSTSWPRFKMAACTKGIGPTPKKNEVEE